MKKLDHRLVIKEIDQTRAFNLYKHIHLYTHNALKTYYYDNHI